MKTKTKKWGVAVMILLTACGISKNEEKQNQGDKLMYRNMVLKEEATEQMPMAGTLSDYEIENHNTESYAYIRENSFLKTMKQPVSTFSVDVDNASYTNVRRMLNNGSLPPVDAVRVEEFVNYFTYTYKTPESKSQPFSFFTEAGDCPWNTEHKLVHIGMKGYTLETSELPASNLVFLIDVSGSMEDASKLPLVKESLNKLVDALNEKDHVSIVVYAGNAGLVLPSTSCNNKQEIKKAISNLEAGGSTAGGEGLALAYVQAEVNFSKTGNNRIIIATDGDFNVGPSSDSEMARMVESKRDKGIYLTVLGFGMGNYKDSKMEIIADKGNGNYFYIDCEEESDRVLVTNLAGTLYTIAKDVKIQVEFNPEKVAEYRLIGYENRLLNEEDFTDDRKDAGEIGAGHTVTAIYEIVPASGTTGERNLKYQSSNTNSLAKTTEEWLTVKCRYKLPDSEVSQEIQQTCSPGTVTRSSDNFKLACSAAAFGMKLRKSEYIKNFSYAQITAIVNEVKNENDEVSGFKKLIRTAEILSEGTSEK